MGTVFQWLVRPRFDPDADQASAWRLRVWASIAALFLAILLMNLWTPLVVFVVIALLYWLYALVRMMHARIRGVHIPTRDDLRERYMEDPDRDL
jgi:Na+/melibiose symporter-like transporter